MNSFFKPTTLKRWQFFTLLGLFLILLIVARLWWADMFSNPKKAHVENGYIDLSDWDEDTEEMLSLNGDWDFYPNNFVIDDSDVKEKITTVPVPSGWNQDDFATKEENENFGYGTYHLQIQVNPDNNQKYSIQFPSIRSSSTLYVNGELTEQIGIPASSKEKYKTQNRPFKSTLHPDENGVIDIKVQVANFDDIRKGGIIRTPKFGTKEVVNNYFDFSIFMQILVIILLILHSIYAIALFLLSHKNTKLLFTAGLFLSISVVIGLAFDEKVFTIFFTVNYLWGFKLVNIASVASSALLLLVTKYENVHFWNKLHYIYMSLIAITAITVLFADVSLITTITPLVSILAVIGIIIAFIALFKMMINQFNTNILLLFSIISIGSYVFWTIYWMNIGINVPYYPLEIIIVIMCVAILWFWYFFKVYQESQNLALELEEINESKDQFLANTAHEFKNPLHSILNITQSVLKKEHHHLKPESIEGLSTVLSVGERLSVLLNDLLDVRYLHKHTPKLNQKAIHVPAVVTGVFDMLKYDAEAKEISLKNEMPQDFPLVLADENRLVQILYNLLNNSVKFTEEGSVSVKAEIQRDTAHITVCDTGPGMEQSSIHYFLKPYEQQKTSERKQEDGFGLGLYISKQLVELHGGTISIASTPNVGTEVTFTLNLAMKEDEDIIFSVSEQSIQKGKANAEVKQVVETPQLSEQTYTNPNILIVDDNPVNLQVIETLLPANEYNIRKATSGDEALQLLHILKWDLIVTDVMMPEMSGYTLTRKIRERFQLMELPILLLTAKSHPNDYRSGFLAGANDYVTKPVEAIEFKARVDSLITMKQTSENQQKLETAWLQAQIQPHFIFNVLNSIIALSEIDLDRMRNLTHEFSVFLRSKFEFQHMQELIPLSEEMSLVESYVYIEKVRFQNRLNIEWEVDHISDANIPRITIQPIVENAINHGVMMRNNGGTVWIRIVNTADYVHITVEDNGVGMKPYQIESLLVETNRNGVGFINTNQRLKKHFGEKLYITSEIDKGTKIVFRIPQHMKDN